MSGAAFALGSRWVESIRALRPAWPHGHRFLVVVATVLFVWFAPAMLAAMTPCLLAGWRDLRVARWLRRVDPDRLRGRLVARCHIVQAMIKICCISFVLLMTIVCLEVGRESAGGTKLSPDGQAPPSVIAIMVIWLACLPIAWLVAMWTVCSAVGNHRRLWLGPESTAAWRSGYWPPLAPANYRQSANGVKWVIWMAVIPTTVLAGIVLMPLVILGVGVACTWSGFSEHADNVIITGSVLGVLISLLRLIVFLITFFEDRIIAGSVHHVWGLDRA